MLYNIIKIRNKKYLKKIKKIVDLINNMLYNIIKIRNKKLKER